MPNLPRRLFDEILIAFLQACDQRDSEIAFELLRVLDFMAMRQRPPSDGEVRRNKHGLVAAHERLWELQHPPEKGGGTMKTFVVSTPARAKCKGMLMQL
jgi:hypothetical protein